MAKASISPVGSPMDFISNLPTCVRSCYASGLIDCGAVKPEECLCARPLGRVACDVPREQHCFCPKDPRFVPGGRYGEPCDDEKAYVYRFISSFCARKTATAPSSTNSARGATATTTRSSTRNPQQAMRTGTHSTSPTSMQQAGGSSLSGGAIAGIVVGALVAVALVFVGGWLIGKRGRKLRAGPSSEMETTGSAEKREELDGVPVSELPANERKRVKKRNKIDELPAHLPNTTDGAHELE